MAVFCVWIVSLVSNLYSEYLSYRPKFFLVHRIFEFHFLCFEEAHAVDVYISFHQFSSHCILNLSKGLVPS